MAKPDSIVTLFEQRVAQSPKAPALRWNGGSWSFEELNARANRLAHFLVSKGVKSETPVGLFALRSPQTLMALVAVLKSGGAYVPLDPTYPSDRIKYYLDDAAIPLVLVDPNDNGKLPSTTAQTFSLDDKLAAGLPETNPGIETGPSSLAHILYTSGSTGKPKGVLIEHRGVMRLARHSANYMPLGPGDVFMQYAPLSFDISTFEIWIPWLNGACVAVPEAGTTSLRDLGQSIRALEVTAMTLTASLMAVMVEQELDSLGGLRQLLSGGDVVSPIHAERFLKKYPNARMINAYGPTENSVLTSCHVIPLENPMPTRLSIGRPIGETGVLILDDKLQPVAAGEVGEMVMTGEGVARGYLNKPELTARAFVEVTDAAGNKVRGYRSGDMGRFNPDGTLDFRGRSDDQVKINGIRIEPGEIRNLLQSHPKVSGAEVVLVENTGKKRLEIFAVLRPGENLDERDLRAFLRSKVPGNWLPPVIRLVPDLPLNNNGKVDRAALLAGIASRLTAGRSGVFEEPQDPLEKAIWSIWRDMLPDIPISRTDRFSDLGGDSLLALAMMARVEKMVGHPVSLLSLFEGGTVVDVANAARETGPVDPPPLMIATQVGGAKPPFFFAHGDYICGGLYCQRIARRLDPDQPFYALAPQGTFNREELPATFEEAAAGYVKMIREVQPQGPYYLGGFCNGAVAMYEVAQQLLKAGETVAALVLLDPPDLYFFILRRRINEIGKFLHLPERKSRAIYQRLAEFVEIWQYEGFQRVAGDFFKRAWAWVRKITGSVLQVKEEESGSSAPNLNFHYYEVMAHYEPKAFLGSRAVWVILRQGESDRCPRQMSYWSGFILDVHFEIVPGTHLELQSSMDEIGRIIQRALDNEKPQPDMTAQLAAARG